MDRLRTLLLARTHTVVMDPDGDIAATYRRLARHVGIAVAGLQAAGQAGFPAITISHDT